MVDYEDCAHPEKVYKNLVFCPDYNPETKDAVLELAKTREGMIVYMPTDENGEPVEDEELCWSCGWRMRDQIYSSYGSRIRIFYTRAEVGIWQVGHRWLIRDQPNSDRSGADFMTQEFLRKQPGLSIPLVKEMRLLSEPTDPVIITLMSRVPGVGLDTIWFTLSPEQKSNYSKQLGAAIKQWRQFTAPKPMRVDGSPIDDCLLTNCHVGRPPSCIKIGRTTEEWFDALGAELRFGLSKIHETNDPDIIEEKFQEIKRNFPNPEPYVLTHGDLHLSNIIVKDDKIQAIIDFERSGYLPWWFEYWSSMQWNTTLFEPIWKDLGVDREWFEKEIEPNVQRFINAWRGCEHYVKHPDYHAKWLRPAFCDCKPYSGAFTSSYIGGNTGHHLTGGEYVPSMLYFL